MWVSVSARFPILLGQLVLAFTLDHDDAPINEPGVLGLVSTGMNHTVGAAAQIAQLLEADSDYAKELGPLAHNALYFATTYLGKSQPTT